MIKNIVEKVVSFLPLGNKEMKCFPKSVEFIYIRK